MSKAGAEHLYMISFEAEEQRSAVLDPAAYFAPREGREETAERSSAPPGAWCVLREPRAAESDGESDGEA